jgi:hypothetical protein
MDEWMAEIVMKIPPFDSVESAVKTAIVAGEKK